MGAPPERAGGGTRGAAAARCGAPERVHALGELVEPGGHPRDLGGERVHARAEGRGLLGALRVLLAGAPVELAHHGVGVPPAAVHREGQRVEILAELRDVLLQRLPGDVGAARRDDHDRGQEGPKHEGEPMAPLRDLAAHGMRPRADQRAFTRKCARRFWAQQDSECSVQVGRSLP